MLRIIRLVLVLGIVGMTAGCFGILGGDPEATATVRVLNDIDRPFPLTIELRRVGSDTKTLGTIAPGEERALNYSSSNLQGTYQLIARQSSGAAVTSREFTLFERAQVQWQVRTNTLSVSQAR
jgi:hypothetical protein